MKQPWDPPSCPQWETQLIWKLAPREAPPPDLIAELDTRLAATQDPDRDWSGLWIDEVSRVRGWAELFQLQLNVADILRDFDFKWSHKTRRYLRNSSLDKHCRRWGT